MTLLLTLILFQAVPDCAAWNSAGAAFSSGVHYFETATAEEVRACLSSGFDPNARIDEYTPLHLAAVAGNLDAIEVLLAAGADPAARLETDSAVDFYTPLEYAVAFGNEAAVEALRNGRARAESTGATASAGQVGDDPYSTATVNLSPSRSIKTGLEDGPPGRLLTPSHSPPTVNLLSTRRSRRWRDATPRIKESVRGWAGACGAGAWPSARGIGKSTANQEPRQGCLRPAARSAGVSPSG